MLLPVTKKPLQLCTQLHISKNTKAKPQGIPAPSVERNKALHFMSMATHTSQSIKELANATVNLNVGTITHRNNSLLIIQI